jgi:hypothetical protein
VDGATLANHILINSGSESQVDLIGNLGHPQVGLRCFISTTARIRSAVGPLGTWFCSLLGRKQQSILSLNQRAMEAQQRGWLEENGYTLEPVWLNPERAESHNQPIPDAEIGRPLT